MYIIVFSRVRLRGVPMAEKTKIDEDTYASYVSITVANNPTKEPIFKQ